jgi:RNA polymerase sigma-70 factor (ECF subfamily)
MRTGKERAVEDQKIVDLYWNRDEDAILHTQRKYGGLCQTIAQNILGNREDAEECVNDAYLKVWNSIPPQRPQSLVAFLSRVVRNLSLDRYRHDHADKRRRGTDVMFSELEECLSDDSVQALSDDEGIADAINRFLRTLDRENRILFVRRYYYMDNNEVLAKTFLLNENTVRQRLFRMREKLKEFLEKEGIGL